MLGILFGDVHGTPGAQITMYSIHFLVSRTRERWLTVCNWLCLHQTELDSNELEFCVQKLSKASLHWRLTCVDTWISPECQVFCALFRASSHLLIGVHYGSFHQLVEVIFCALELSRRRTMLALTQVAPCWRRSRHKQRICGNKKS